MLREFLELSLLTSTFPIQRVFVLALTFSTEILILNANSVDSEQGLHCLSMSLSLDTRNKRVSWSFDLSN